MTGTFLIFGLIYMTESLLSIFFISRSTSHRVFTIACKNATGFFALHRQKSSPITVRNMQDGNMRRDYD